MERVVKVWPTVIASALLLVSFDTGCANNSPSYSDKSGDIRYYSEKAAANEQIINANNFINAESNRNHTPLMPD